MNTEDCYVWGARDFTVFNLCNLTHYTILFPLQLSIYFGKIQYKTMPRNVPNDVINTSYNVSYSKRSCVDSGYYQDDFIRFFTTRYEETSVFDFWFYLRVKVIRELFDKFVECLDGQRVQYVNLGCGLDTSSFYFLQTYKNVVCYDVDFLEHLKYKSSLMDNSKKFSFLNYKIVDGLIVSDQYKMVPMDFEDVENVYKMEEMGISRDLPTFFLSEYCLTYVENDKSDKVVQFLSSFSREPSVYVFFDYIGSWTKFGRWYSKVFDDFGAEFKSLRKYDTLEKHTKRHKELGWDFVSVNPLTFTYNELINDEERQRITNLKKFKRFEELAIYGNHTAVGAALTHPAKLSKLANAYSPNTGAGKEKDFPEFIPYDKGLNQDDFDKDYFTLTLKQYIR